VEGLKILGLCVVAAIVYGILHDMVTAHLCVAYFTVFHPDIFGTGDPTLLALGWGVIATWWVGFFLGLLIVAATRTGRLPKLTWRQLVKPLTIMLAASMICAFISGLVAYADLPNVPGWITETKPVIGGFQGSEKQWFMVDLYAHNASYIASTIGGLVVCAWAIWKRAQLGIRESVPLLAVDSKA
jgi:hypothetical protein